MTNQASYTACLREAKEDMNAAKAAYEAAKADYDELLEEAKQVLPSESFDRPRVNSFYS